MATSNERYVVLTIQGLLFQIEPISKHTPLKGWIPMSINGLRDAKEFNPLMLTATKNSLIIM